MAFYPLLMHEFHTILNTLSISQKKALKNRPETFKEALQERFDEVVHTFEYDELRQVAFLEEMRDYKEHFLIEEESFYFSPKERAKCLVRLFLHYTTTRIEPDKQLGIALCEVHLAGTAYVKGIEEITQKMINGQRIVLQWEKENPYDKYAIKAITQEGQKLGYIPREKNRDFIYLLEQEYELFAVLKRVVWAKDRLDIKLIVYVKP